MGRWQRSFFLIASFAQSGKNIFRIQFCNIGHGDFLRTNRLACLRVGTAPETFLIHLSDHIQRACFPFRISLWKECKMRNLCGDEKHGRGILAGRHTGAATYAGSGGKGSIGMAGSWNVTVEARRNGQILGAYKTRLDAR